VSRISHPLLSSPAALLRSPDALRLTALAAVVANVGIVVTGGAVRLTGSGLGCPTWPRCTAESYIVTGAMGINGAIEFGNRLLTFAVGLVAAVGIAVALLQRPRRRRPVVLAALVFAGIPAQAVVGGLTVLTNLNPWVVGCHFLVSMGVLAASYAFWRAAGGGARYAWIAPSALRGLGAAVLAVTAAVLVAGTVVTGSGPHAGDAKAVRTGLDPQAVSQFHADGVFLLVGLSIGLWFAVRAAGGPARAAAVLVAVELAQGAVGFAQYLTGLPVVLVAAHMAGACAVWLAALSAYAALPRRAATPVPDPPEPPIALPETLTLSPAGRPAT
jgi:heme a synthase